MNYSISRVENDQMTKMITTTNNSCEGMWSESLLKAGTINISISINYVDLYNFLLIIKEH